MPRASPQTTLAQTPRTAHNKASRSVLAPLPASTGSRLSLATDAPAPPPLLPHTAETVASTADNISPAPAPPPPSSSPLVLLALTSPAIPGLFHSSLLSLFRPSIPPFGSS